MIPFSVLDLAPVVEGGDAQRAFANSLDLARHVEAFGYHRFWLAEHHNMPGVASAATAVAIAHVGSGTSKIRLGAGGIMLPNHAPLVIAEQFGTLDALYPGRIDLGIGRAPGTDPLTARALRRNLAGDIDSFPQDVLELMSYFRPVEPGQAVQAVPGAGANIDVWILGSSLFGAQLAAALGLPYAFASHFAPAQLTQAIEVYRSRFKPSEQLARPKVMLGVNVVVAETDADAKFLWTSLQQMFVSLRRGRPGKVPAPLLNYEENLEPTDRLLLEQSLSCSFVGSKETVSYGLEAFIKQTKPDELIISSPIYDHEARLKSYEHTAQIREQIAARKQRSEPSNLRL